MGDVRIIDCALPTEVPPPKAVSRHIIRDYRDNFDGFYNQPLKYKVHKYLVGLYQALRQMGRSNVVLYCFDLSLLQLLLPFRNLLSGKRWRIIYHQYELIEFNSAAPKLLEFLQPDLLIFPEANRLNYFTTACFGRGQSSPETLVLPNSNSGKRFATEQSTIDALEAWANNRRVVGHIGNVGPDHFFDVFENLILHGDPQDLCFIMVGKPHPELKSRLTALGQHENVCIVDQVSHGELGSYYSVMDLGLILYKPVNLNFDFCAPNKLYEYWAHGVPVLAHQLRGLDGVFPSNDFGTTLDFYDESITAEILEMLRDQKLNAISESSFYQNAGIDNHLTEFNRCVESLLD